MALMLGYQDETVVSNSTKAVNPKRISCKIAEDLVNRTDYK